MVRILKVLVITALTAVLIAGLTTSVCCDGVDGNGDTPNGDTPNGQVPNEGEPDLVSGYGSVTDCDEYTGQVFQDKDPAPDFRFEDAAGQTFSLSDFQGKSVMLNFWRTTCGYCTMQLPYIQGVYDEWDSGELVILTIDLGEDTDKVKDYLDGLDISLPVLLDMEGRVAAQYRVSGIPVTFFINTEGLIRYVKLGAFQSQEELESVLTQFIAL